MLFLSREPMTILLLAVCLETGPTVFFLYIMEWKVLEDWEGQNQTGEVGQAKKGQSCACSRTCGQGKQHPLRYGVES